MEDDAPPGVPEWVVTYGDMMSLLLTFFIMLVSLSEVVADKKYQAILEALMTYTGYETGPRAPEGKNFPLSGLVEKLEVLGSFNEVDEGRGGNRRRGVEGDERVVRRYREGTARRVLQPVPFPVDSAELSAEARDLIAQIAREIDGKQHKIEIHGHCSPFPRVPTESPATITEPDDAEVPDPEPRDANEMAAVRIEANFREERLSYMRARAVLEELVRLGIDADRLRIRTIGSAEADKESSDRKMSLPDRVDVRILDQVTDDLIGRDLPN